MATPMFMIVCQNNNPTAAFLEALAIRLEAIASKLVVIAF